MEEGKRERWTAKKKKELVLQIIKKEKSLADACRAHDLKQSEVQDWINTFLKSGEQGLKTTSKEVSIRKICSVLGITRSNVYYRSTRKGTTKRQDKEIESSLYQLIQKYP